jgi:hypothetical protein
MTTGRLGWKGGLIGALLGTGTSAYLNPEARKKLMSTIKDRFGSGEDVPESELGLTPGDAVKLDGPNPSKGSNLTDKQYYDRFKEALSSDHAFSDEQRAGMQNFVDSYDSYQKDLTDYRQDVATGVSLQKDPRFKRILDEARSGTYFDKLSPGDDADVSRALFRYTNEYKQKMGKDPSPAHLQRFTRDARAGLVGQDNWDSYMTDTHASSGTEEYPLELMAGQVAGGQSTGKLSKPVIEKMMKTKGGQKALEKLFGKGATKMGAAKLSAKAVPGLNLAFDVPEFFVDPNTGEYTMDVGKNIAEQDRLMELRENYGTMPTGEKRNMLYNMSGGALRGWLNPLTSYAIHGKRWKDTIEEGAQNIKNRGFSEGAKSNFKALASAGATVGDELWSPIQDIASKKKVRPGSYTWGSDVKTPTAQELKAVRDQIANRRGYYEVDGKRIPIQEYHKKEGEDRMDKVELVRRYIRKQASMNKEANRYLPGRTMKRIFDSNPPIDTTAKVTKPPARMDTLKDWAKKQIPGVNRSTAYKGLGLTAAGAGLTGLYFGGADDAVVDKEIENRQPISNKEIKEAHDKRAKAGQSSAQVENAPVPPELLAGAGGALAGGAAGYALAPTLGISRGVGTLGGGALTAVASALLANKLKNSNSTSKLEKDIVDDFVNR